VARRRGPILALLLLVASCGAPHEEPVRLVLLVTVDTLRADRLGSYGSDRGLTPHLDALAADSQVFEAAYAPTSHTLPSIAGVLTGRYPQELGITGNLSELPAGTETLATRLRDAGFRTAAVVSNWVLRRASGFDAGFERYDDALPEVEATRPMPERGGAATTAAALAALDACLPDAAARCFLWVHYQDPHGPYTPDPAERERRLERERAAPDGRRELPLMRRNFGFGGIPDYQAIGDQREVAFYRAGYDAEVAAVDAAIGQLLDGVSRRVAPERTLVVFTADHGESLGEDDYWFGHGDLLSEPLVRVPLLVRAPHRTPGARRDIASLVDLAPTLLEQLAAEPEAPAPLGAGRALLAPAAERADSAPFLATLQGSDVPRAGVVEGDFKYVVAQRAGVWDGRLTRRGDDATDFTAAAPQLAARLRGRLEELLARHPLPAEAPAAPLASEDREQLERLGYLDP
jgi:arylsulfatase